jgi:DNA repair exonuclease SbcCD ATPase subunit
MAKSPSQRIEELTQKIGDQERRLDHLTIFVELQIAKLEQGLKDCQASLKELSREQQQTATKQAERLAAVEAKNASLDERCQALQKLSDRGWQIWLALIGAGLALLVAFLKK